MTDASTPPSPASDASDAANSGAIVSPEVGWAPPAAPRSRGPRVGRLTPAWQIMVAASWSAAFFAFAGVWKASEEIGIATWWLGPRADPQPIWMRIIPFVVTVVVALLAVYNIRGVPWISLGGTAAIAAIAAFDLPKSTGLALAEFSIAAALLLVSLASLGGRYQPATGPAATPTAEPSTAAAPTVPPTGSGSPPPPAPPQPAPLPAPSPDGPPGPSPSPPSTRSAR